MGLPIRFGILATTFTAMICSRVEADQFRGNLRWSTVVNNLDDIPGMEIKFNSYNQPSINSHGFMVFRARSKGADHVSGIFTRDLASNGSVITMVIDRNAAVPSPNNTGVMFTEFPSIPRISANTRTIATRGNSQPVWVYSVGADEETRAGTTGIFVNPGGVIATGVNLLGAVPEPASPVIGENYFPIFSVPGAPEGTKFDVFPGSPSITDSEVIVFKGNYTDVESKTGVYYRDLRAQGGIASVELIANSDTLIPGTGDVEFGSTAPPSAHGSEMVFLGLDNEDAPTLGGIYLAPLSPSPALTTLVAIGEPVPGVEGETFNKIGEALSFDGRYVAFWAAWGEETRDLLLECPAHGNRDLLDYCKLLHPDGYATTVPVNQGIFVHDTNTGETKMIARTGEQCDDFIYWGFSGRPPGVGGGDEEVEPGELARWRSASFVSVSAGPDGLAFVAFKGRSGVDRMAPVDGIYLGSDTEVVTLLDTTMSGSVLDPEAPAGTIISTLAIERESYRGRWLAVSAGMEAPVLPSPPVMVEDAEEEVEGLAGLYVLEVGIRPDARVGKTITGMFGNDIYRTLDGQTLKAKSKNAEAVHAVFAVQNDGDVPDRFLVRGTKGKRYFKITYNTPTGNVTGALKAGTYLTRIQNPDQMSESIKATVKPKRNLLRKRAGESTKRLRVHVDGTSVSDASEKDSNRFAVKAEVQTRRKPASDGGPTQPPAFHGRSDISAE